MSLHQHFAKHILNCEIDFDLVLLTGIALEIVALYIDIL